MKKRHFPSKGFQPLALATQGVSTPWEVSAIFTDILNLALPKVNSTGLAFVLALFFFLSPTKISEACGPYYDNFHGYSFVNLDILNKETALAPYALIFSDIFENYFKATEDRKLRDNLAEWEERFCGQVEKKDLQFLIYKAAIEDLELLKTSARSKNLPVPYRLRGNTFAEHLRKQKCLETIDYLIYAKRCEPHVVGQDGWGAKERDFSTMRFLVGVGRKQFRKTQSAYIRLRYAYQIIRLAHYAKDYEETLNLYDDLMPKIDKVAGRTEDSILPFWILGHKAGALRALGKNVEASYLYALIFRHCPSRRVSAFRSFYIKTDSEWKQCLLLCQDDEERATLYALRANAAKSKAVEEMEKIYELNPTDENLEILLVKEIKKMEKNLLGLGFNPQKNENKRYFDLPEKYAGDHVIRLQKFARKCRKEKKVSRPQLWRLAEGYLEFLAGDFYAAGKSFETVQNEINDPLLKEQLAAFELALKITALEKVDGEVEKDVYNILKKNPLYRKYEDFPKLLKDKMAALYKAAGHPGKAFICQHSLKDLKPNPQEDILNDLLTVAQDEKQTQFERLLTGNAKGEKITNDLWDIKASLLMSENYPEAALEAFKGIPRTQWDDFGVFNPFRETLNDCINCRYARDTSELYNKGELLEELLDLEMKARGGLDKGAPYYYRMGLAFYNMSYFGYAWNVADYYRSGSSWSYLSKNKDGIFANGTFPFGNRENIDVSKAFYFFEKTRTLATDPELAAKATFMVAKCEQKMYFISDDYQPEECCNNIPRLPEQYLTAFNRLKDNYSDTQFYQKAIRECKYFEAFALK